MAITITPKIKRKMWNIIKLFRQVSATLDILEDLLAKTANGQKIQLAEAIAFINKMFAIYKVPFSMKVDGTLSNIPIQQ